MMGAEAFLEALRSGTIRGGAECRSPIATTEDGRPLTLPVKLLRRPEGPLHDRPLVVVFHGAVDRKKRGFPYYGGGYALDALGETDALVLSISDPSLWLSPRLRTAWYAANRYADVPRAIHEFLFAVTAILSPSRLIFTGNSTGGHPALAQSARFEDCVCVVSNPIARISRYHSQAVERYLSTCWGPAAAARRDGDALPGGVLDDCGTIYRNGHRHSLIVVQNATDPHLLLQAVPFAARIRDPERLLFLSAFFPGSIGHVVPHALMARWLLAATRARTAACPDIAQAYGSAEATVPPASTAASGDPDLAARIVAAVLGR